MNSMRCVDTLGNLICFELTSQAFQCIIPLNKVALELEMEKNLSNIGMIFDPNLHSVRA